MSDSFVIWTRYERPDGKVVRHAFGPFATRQRAKTALKRMIENNREYHNDFDDSKVEAFVTKLIE